LDRLTFPNYTQIPSRLPIRWWQAIRVMSILGALVDVSAPLQGLREGRWGVLAE
jgi:hypothetical protein